jgi:hypothetical protein
MLASYISRFVINLIGIAILLIQKYFGIVTLARLQCVPNSAHFNSILATVAETFSPQRLFPANADLNLHKHSPKPRPFDLLDD